MKISNKIKFTSGIMTKIDADYYDMHLYNREGERVYSVTLSRLDAAQVMNDYNNIKMQPEMNQVFKVGAVVNWSTPPNQHDKYKIVELFNDGNVTIELICDYKMKPTLNSNVKYLQIAE